MKEIEVKIIDINKEDLETKLAEIGASGGRELHLEAHYFYTGNPEDVLRVRYNGYETVVTHKTGTTKAAVRSSQEDEIIVSHNLENAIALMESLGKKEIVEKKLEKKRTSYAKQGILYEIDEFQAPFDYVPAFLEIEGPSEEAVLQAAEELGFTRDQCLNWTSKELIEHYKP